MHEIFIEKRNHHMNSFSSTYGSASFFLRQKIVQKLITFLKKKEQPLKPNYSKDSKMAYASHMLFYGGFIRMQLKRAKEMMNLGHPDSSLNWTDLCCSSLSMLAMVQQCY